MSNDEEPPTETKITSMTSQESDDFKITKQPSYYPCMIIARDTLRSQDEAIFDAYDRGPTAADILASQYNSTNINCYGFILDVKARYSDEKILDESLRVKRWTKILYNWEKHIEKDKKLIRTAIFQGIPNCLRAQVWRKLLNLDAKLEDNIGVYKRLVRVARATSKDAIQIDKDVERTCRLHVLFNVRYSTKQRDLFYLLLAYSVYDIKIRYCQGMNEIAAVLLMFLTEEETFWALTILTCDEIHNIHGFFSEGFPKVKLFEKHFLKVMEGHMPKLMDHMNNTGYEITICTTRWFILFFINCLPFPVVLRIWDRFMLEGSIILIPIAFSVFKFFKNRIMKLSLEGLSEFFKSLEFLKFDTTLFFEKLEKNIKFLSNHKLYPIPGVAHSVVDIDITTILSDDNYIFESNQDISDSARSFRMQDDNMRRSYEKLNSNSDGSKIFVGGGLFNPQEVYPPSPDKTWNELMKSHKEKIISQVDLKEINAKAIPLEKISKIYF